MNDINMNNTNEYMNMDENLYKESLLTERILVPPRFLNNKINDFIQNELVNKIEEKCIDEGYIKKDSIKIMKKSIGQLKGSQFNGYITYNVLYKAFVCHPKNGDIIKCKVKFINKLGILGNNGPLTIIIGRQFHKNQDEIDRIKQGEKIDVEVIASKFSLNDKEIKIISKLKLDNETTDQFIDTDMLDEQSDIESLDNFDTSQLNTEDDLNSITESQILEDGDNLEDENSDNEDEDEEENQDYDFDDGEEDNLDTIDVNDEDEDEDEEENQDNLDENDENNDELDELNEDD